MSLRTRTALRAETRANLNLGDVLTYLWAITVQGSHTSPSTVTCQVVTQEGLAIAAPAFARVRVCDAPGGINSITVAAAGSGYTSVPTVAIAAPPAGGVQATATAVLTSEAITSFTITNAGAGYITAPAVTITGGGGTLGAGTAVVAAGYATATSATIAAGSGTTLVETITSTKDLVFASSALGLFTLTFTNATVGSGLLRLAAGLSSELADFSPTLKVTHA